MLKQVDVVRPHLQLGLGFRMEIHRKGKDAHPSLEQLIEEPPIALGRPPGPFCTGEELLDALVPHFLELFRRGPVIAIHSDDLRSDACSRHPERHQCPVDQSLPHHDRLARTHLAGGLRRLAVHGNTSRAAGARSKAARPEDADGPEPFVHTFGFWGRVHRG